MFEYKACSLQYFLDDMQNYELNIILEFLEYNYKQQWEMARFQSYIQAQTQSSKKLNLKDIIHFNWDKDNKDDKKIHSISNEDIQRLSEKANKIIQEKNTSNNG